MTVDSSQSTPNISSLELISGLAPKRSGEYAFRDERFFEQERELDALIETASPEDALPIEEELLGEVKRVSRVPEGLARVTLKAIAISQIARQFNPTNAAESTDVDQTYMNLGTLLEKTLRQRHHLAWSETPSDFEELRATTGVISEMVFYALAAYDATLTRTLTGRTLGATPRYILPATIDEDLGSNPTSGLRTGFDYIATYVEGDDPYRYVQVKTTREIYKRYDPTIVVVPINSLHSSYKRVSTVLPRAIIIDSHNPDASDNSDYINRASKHLNKLIQ
ncbi:MAG TPA: hypothetical protein VN081_04145 [Dongiaceae bacterium]|nr:hypothetical protein [Dongiaceae bacterium]